MSPRRRYAEDTSVPIARSRGQIDDLLRDWGASGFQWTDDFEAASVTLRFKWPGPGGFTYMARFDLALPTIGSIQVAEGPLSPSKLEARVLGGARAAYRALLLWLKAAFVAVDAGIVRPEELFLPFLEGRDGKTVGETALPHIERLLTGSATKLLGGGA